MVSMVSQNIYTHIFNLSLWHIHMLKFIRNVEYMWYEFHTQKEANARFTKEQKEIK